MQCYRTAIVNNQYLLVIDCIDPFGGIIFHQCSYSFNELERILQRVVCCLVTIP